jgi:hypothetical protein
MMIGWLVWEYEDTLIPSLFDEEPDNWVFMKKQIVYAEVI